VSAEALEIPKSYDKIDHYAENFDSDGEKAQILSYL